MPQEYLLPKSDLIFKKIFGDENNIDILSAFLQSVLDIPAEEYAEVTLLDTHFKLENENDKLGILDVKVRTKSEKIIDVEIQLRNVPYMRERLIFYLSKMISEQIKSGEGYKAIKKSVIIIITDYKMISDSDKYHNVYTMRDENGRQFSDLIEINTLELPKLPHDDDKSALWTWMKFLNSKNEEEFKMVETKSKSLEKAVCVLKRLSADEITKLEYDAREKARLDHENMIQGSFDMGKAEGETEGVLKGVIAMVGKHNISLSVAMADLNIGEEHKHEIIKLLQEKGINYKD